jgi:hypothetical protein
MNHFGEKSSADFETLVGKYSDEILVSFYCGNRDSGGDNIDFEFSICVDEIVCYGKYVVCHAKIEIGMCDGFEYRIIEDDDVISDNKNIGEHLGFI